MENKSTKTQQCIKIIAETVVNLRIVAPLQLHRKLKDLSSAVGYYSYT